VRLASSRALSGGIVKAGLRYLEELEAGIVRIQDRPGELKSCTTVSLSWRRRY